MSEPGITTRYSICLLLDKSTMESVNRIRQSMPVSPFRDDTPHVTLLNAIKSPAMVSDRELLENMDTLLGLSKILPFTVKTQKSANRWSPLFKNTSMVLLQASPEMRAYRKKMIKILNENNFSVEPLARLLFKPHISVRLGVPFSKGTKELSEKAFSPHSEIALNKWVIFRDIRKDGKYLVKEIALSR